MSKQVPLFYKGVEVGTAMVMNGYTFKIFDPKTDKVEFKKYGELKWKSSVEDESVIETLFTRFTNKYPNAIVTKLEPPEENCMFDGMISIEFSNAEDEAIFIVQES